MTGQLAGVDATFSRERRVTLRVVPAVLPVNMHFATPSVLVALSPSDGLRSAGYDKLATRLDDLVLLQREQGDTEIRPDSMTAFVSYFLSRGARPPRLAVTPDGELQATWASGDRNTRLVLSFVSDREVTIGRMVGGRVRTETRSVAELLRMPLSPLQLP
jgi:hypothetical protein